MKFTDAIHSFQQPEHTGANRCTPCTVVNLVIAAIVAGAVTLFAPWVGAIVFVVFGGVIYLRGYLVPGTPTLTKRYLPAWILKLFGKQPVEHLTDDGRLQTAGSERADHSGVEALTAANIVRHFENDVSLDPEFRNEWNKRISAYRGDPPKVEAVRTMINTDNVSRHGDRSFVVDGDTTVRWDSDAAFIADVTAESLLAERLDEWSTLEWNRKRSVLLGLRLCLDECPSCDGVLSVTKDRIDPCCQKPHLIVDSVCQDCGAPLADAAMVDNAGDKSIRLRLLQS